MADKADLCARYRVRLSNVSRVERSYGTGVSTDWFRAMSRRPLSIRKLGSFGYTWNMEGRPMTTARILDFINTRRPEGPCLVVDLDVVRDNYSAFRHALPDSSIYYAVKANPAPEILRLLAGLGSNFDCAGVAEIEMALNAGATPAQPAGQGLPRSAQGAR